MNKLVAFARVVIPAVIFVITAVGLFGSQFKQPLGAINISGGQPVPVSVHYYLYKSVQEANGTQSTIIYADVGRAGFPCPVLYDYITTSLAAGIIGWMFMFAGVIGAAISISDQVPRMIRLGSHFMCWPALAGSAGSIVFAGMYYTYGFCDPNIIILSLSDYADVDYGFIILIVSGVLSLGWCVVEGVSLYLMSRKVPNGGNGEYQRVQ